VGTSENHVEARFPVQWVVRPQSREYHDFRGYAGRVAGGVFRAGDEVMVMPSGFSTKVKSVHGFQEEIPEAYAPMSVVMTLEDEIDISRGNMIVKPNSPPKSSQDIDAMICWFSDRAPLAGHGRYILRHTTNEVKAVVKDILYKVNINTLHKIEGVKEFTLNEIGRISLRTSGPLFHDSYRRNRQTGAFILIDEGTNETVAAGMIV
jgi:sulfate adenylyltransferase subunit 1